MTKPDDAHLRPLIDRAVTGDRAALEEVVASIQQDLFNLALRMLGGRPEAEDATQEILVQIVTHLAQWRGDSSFRTWTWRIAVRHLMRARRSKDEEVATFEAIEQLIEMGVGAAPLTGLSEAEVALLEEEVRLACTQGMLTSLDRDQRISLILAETFELDSEQAADVLDVDAATHRKRTSRARKKLGEWMSAHCGIVDPENPCRCRRQIPVAIQVGAIDPQALQFVTRGAASPPARRTLPLATTADELELAALVVCCHPDHAAPTALLDRIRALIDSGSVRLLS